MKKLRNNQQPAAMLFDNPLWDINKTAAMLSVSVSTLRDWVYKRQIPFKKVGNLVRFDPSEIQKWIEERNHYGH
ncbi:helix-turn-helix domain-containing protein [bacterium]|nr:helix-turn-helix domain-containing protein [bacterium]